MIRVMSYGKLMCGGWYASLLEKGNNEYTLRQYKTLKELKADMLKNNVPFTVYKLYRYDNI